MIPSCLNRLKSFCSAVVESAVFNHCLFSLCVFFYVMVLSKLCVHSLPFCDFVNYGERSFRINTLRIYFEEAWFVGEVLFAGGIQFMP